MPGGALHLIEPRRRSTASSGSSRCTATRASTSARSGCGSGRSPAPPTGVEVRLAGHRRPHLAPAPDRRPDLRAGQGHHRAARRCSRRRLDPRAGVSVVWGIVHAGSARQRDPATAAWSPARCGSSTRWPGPTARRWSASSSHEIVRAVRRDRPGRLPARRPAGGQRAGLPPDPGRGGRSRCLGDGGRVAAHQSLGGEDFGWYLDRVPGAMARLGTRTPGGPTYDLHQGNLRVDERATAIGARVLANAAVRRVGHRPITTSETLRRLAARIGPIASTRVTRRASAIGRRTRDHHTFQEAP